MNFTIVKEEGKYFLFPFQGEEFKRLAKKLDLKTKDFSATKLFNPTQVFKFLQDQFSRCAETGILDIEKTIQDLKVGEHFHGHVLGDTGTTEPILFVRIANTDLDQILYYVMPWTQEAQTRLEEVQKDSEGERVYVLKMDMNMDDVREISRLFVEFDEPRLRVLEGVLDVEKWDKEPFRGANFLRKKMLETFMTLYDERMGIQDPDFEISELILGLYKSKISENDCV